jgi:predicted O-methyltransferase YrrM
MRWTDIPGHFDFQDIYDEAVRSAEDGSRFVEVGILLGRSTSYMCEAIHNSQKNIKLDSIDSFEEPFACVADQFEHMDITKRRHYGLPDEWPKGHFKNLFKFAGCNEGLQHFGISTYWVARKFLFESGSCDVVNIIQGKGQEKAALYPNKSLDFVFIDASHTLPDTESLLRAFLPKMKPGSILAGHDFTNQFPGVMQAVAIVLGDDVKRVSNSFVKHIA